MSKLSDVLEKIEELEGKVDAGKAKASAIFSLARYAIEFIEYLKASRKGTVLVKPPKLPEDYDALRALAFADEED